MKSEYIHLIPDEMLPVKDDILCVCDKLYLDIANNCDSRDKLADWQNGIIEIFNQKLANDPKASHGLLLQTIMLPMVVDIVRVQLSIKDKPPLEIMEEMLRMAKDEVVKIESSKRSH